MEKAMSALLKTDPIVAAQVIELVTRERAKALSPREWKHRLAGYGYGIRATEAGQMIETLPKRVPICELPAHLCA
jgi:hypothetical protein